MGRDKCGGTCHSLYNGSASNLPINARHTHTHTHTQAAYDITLTQRHLHLATLPTWRPQGCPQLLFTPGWSRLLLFSMLLHPETPPAPCTHSLRSASLFYPILYLRDRPPPLSTSSPHSHLTSCCHLPQSHLIPHFPALQLQPDTSVIICTT